MYLESPQNPRIKEWSKLKSRKGRLETGQFLVEGVRLVEEALRSSLEVIALLWDAAADDVPDTLMDVALERGVPIIEVAPHAFASVADTVTPQGILGIVRIPSGALDPIGSDSHETMLPEWGIVLDGVQDPGNVGTLIRGADAFGVKAVLCGTGTADPYAPKVVRASMGGIFRVPVGTGSTTAVIQAWRKRWPDGQVIVSSTTAETNCYEANLAKPSLLVIGGEAFGVSAEAEASADIAIRIPMSGMTESLNAAMAGTVILYEMFRQRAVHDR